MFVNNRLKKLELNQEAVRNLTQNELQQVVSGFGTHACSISCRCQGTHTCAERNHMVFVSRK